VTRQDAAAKVCSPHWPAVDGQVIHGRTAGPKTGASRISKSRS